MNSNLLKAKIVEKGYTQQSLAKEVGMAANSMNRKVLGEREFKLSEVVAICDTLEIDDPKSIFFEE